MDVMIETSDLLVAKVLAMCVLGCASFLIGVLPTKLAAKWWNMANSSSDKSSDDKNLFISLLLCFGGGVLLFTTFLHLQPEVRENFTQLELNNVMGHGISLCDIVFCLGFFFVYLIEETVHYLIERKMCDHHHRSKIKESSFNIPRVTLNNKDEKQVTTTTPNLSITTTTVNLKPELHGHGHLHHQQHHHQQQQQHNHSHNVDANSFRGLLAVLALSFHAVFEGLAVGLENSVQKVWYLFAAIATHKLVIAFCVGVELVTSKTKFFVILIYMGTFALVTPLGIGIGIMLSETGTSEIDVTSVVLQGMAAGTLLYVVFFEVLARERSNQHCGIWQLFAIIAGFLVMFALQYITGHEHSHGGSHDHELDHYVPSTPSAAAAAAPQPITNLF